MDEAALDLALQRAWPPGEKVAIGPWTARLDGGVTRRANSVLPHGDGAAPDDATLDLLLTEAAALYARRRQPPWLQLTGAAWPPRLERRLAERGWQTSVDPTLVLAGPLPVGNAPTGVTLEPTPSPSWLATWWAVDPRGGSAELETISALLARIEVAAFATAVEGATVVGVALGVVVERALVVECLATQPEARRRGVATRTVEALAHWGAPRGAQRIVLAVQATNHGARGLYRSLGLEQAGGYAYARPPA